jgi:hypothetical protein
VNLSSHDTFPPRSKPNNKAKIIATKVVAPAKSTRLSFTLRSAFSELGSLSARETKMIAIMVAGT